MQSEIFQTVVRVIANNNGIAPDVITIDSTFEDLNMDSLDGLTLINDLETHYNIQIPNEHAMTIRSIRETVERLERVMAIQES
jgi:acyl carrier protein